MKGIVNYVKDNEFRMNVLENKIDIVNYHDLLSMNEEKISLTSPIGRIIIKGFSLSVKKLLNKEILVVGKIISIEMGDKNV